MKGRIMTTFGFWSVIVIALVAAYYAGEWYGGDEAVDVEDPNDVRVKMSSSSSLRGNATTATSTVDNNTISQYEATTKPVLVGDGTLKVPGNATKDLTNDESVDEEDEVKMENETTNSSSKEAVPSQKENTRAKTPEELMLAFFSSQKCHVSDEKEAAPWLKQMFVQIGVQKGGTKAIHTFLEEHPHFVTRCAQDYATFELNYFNFHFASEKQTIDRDQYALQKGYEELIQESCPLAVEDLKKHEKMLYMDDSPLYMQDSDSIPQLLNCVMPQAKILAILRNPTDRAFSHFNFYLELGHCGERSFDEWVDLNIQDLHEAGVLEAQDPYQELLAWQKYNTRNDRRCRTFVSRGLYAIQLLHYKTALLAAGRSPEELMVVHSSDMKGANRQAVYDEILDFLGLEPHVLQREAPVHKTDYKTELQSATRQKLQEFYQPYNHRLYQLLEWTDYSWD